MTSSLKLSRQLDQQGFISKPQLRAQLEQKLATELRRLQQWLVTSESAVRFTHERPANLQTELRRRINHLERSRQP